jgi:pilus assembly protein CpaE
MVSEEKTRVLIVDDDSETRENLRKLLQFDAQIEMVGAAVSGTEGIDMAVEFQPDVVLMDINLPDIDGITATENIRVKIPFTQIVIVSVQNESSFMRRAMLAGARDYLTKPINVDELSAAIHRAGKVARNEKEKQVTSTLSLNGTAGNHSGTLLPGDLGKVVTVFSPKGGSGKTTVTANLAVALSQIEKTVAAVDGNLQFGDLSFFFSEQGRNNVTDLAPHADVLDREVVGEVMVQHEKSGVHILAAPMRPEYADEVNGNQFGAIVRYLSRVYPFVLVDTSSLLSDITIAALDASDLILLPTTQDIPSIKNTRLFLDVADALGLSTEKILLVMNRFDKRRSITPERVSENLKKEISAVIPMDEKVVVPAMDRGEPFVLQNQSSPSATAINELRNSVLQVLKDQAPVELETA